MSAHSVPIRHSGKGQPPRSRRPRRGGALQLHALRLRDIWRFVLRQPPSYWLIVLYLFVEYVRPQSIYRSIDVLPWGQTALIACTAALLLEGKKPRPLQGTDWLLGAFTLVVIVSCFFGYYPDWGFDKLYVMLSWVLVYWLITNIVDTEARYLLFLLSFFLHSFKMSQHAFRSWASHGFGFRSWGVFGPPGWFADSGELVIQMGIFLCLSLVFVLALRHYWSRLKLAIIAFAFPFTALIAVVGSSSRGGQIGVGAALLWLISKSKYRIRAVLAAVLIGTAAYALLPQEQKDRFSAMGDDKTSQRRIQYWEDALVIIQDHPVLGIGYESWLPFYRTRYDPSGQVVHNIFLEAGTELGLIGLGLFLALIIATFVLNYRTRRLAARLGEQGRFMGGTAHGLDASLVAYMVAGFFVTVLYYPFFWINLSFTVALNHIAQKRVRQAAAARRRLASRAAAPAPPVGPGPRSAAGP